MSSDTAVDIVCRGEEYHRTLGAFYRGLRQRATNERTKMALEFLEQHESGLESALRAYGKDIPAPQSDRWFKYSPNEALEKEIKAADVQPDIPVEKLLDLAQQLGEGLVRYYRQFAETAVPEDLQEAMEHLLQLEQEGQKRVSSALQEQLTT